MFPSLQQQHRNSISFNFNSPVSVRHPEMDASELYSGRKHPREMRSETEEGEGIELNLGLSLGGKFGVNRSHGGLIRSSSVANWRAGEALGRTASMPVKADEEWRRRKEMQSLRRLEAKRRRCGKQRKETGEERRLFGSGIVPAPAQGSGESHWGGSSELDGKGHKGSGSCGGARSPASILSAQERSSKEPSPIVSSTFPKNSDNKKVKEAGNGGIGDMPCVFTTGDGPNGRKVEGILYKYGKGEEVRIMCICHGSFFNPAEFVTHAGCRDVEHPLRHIVVNPSPTFF